MEADFEIELDFLGQQPFLRLYTQITLCYPLPATTKPSAQILDPLRKGLERLVEVFPWTAGQLTNKGASETSTGTFYITPFERLPQLVVKDVTDDNDVPSMEEMRRAGFPMTMFDETLIAPRMTLPLPGDMEREWPIFIIQATFVRGGLLLTFLGEHNVMDIVGQGQVMDLLNTACLGGEFDEGEVAAAKLERHTLVPLLDDDYDPLPDVMRQCPKADAAPPTPPPECSWEYVRFSGESLKTLKEEASKTLPSNVKFVSTDDALSALIWQATTRARIPRLQPDAETTFARAIDMRSFLNVHPKYPGILLDMTYNTLPAKTLATQPLGETAALLRSELDPKTSTLAHHTRALATHMARSEDKRNTSSTASIVTSTDITLSSWAKMDFYELDFGLGFGKPEAVRRPRFPAVVESLMYLMPKRGDGEIVLGLCVRDQDMMALKSDNEFGRYGVWIG